MKKFAVPLLKLTIAAVIVTVLILHNSDGLLTAFRAIHPGWLGGVSSLRRPYLCERMALVYPPESARSPVLAV